MASNDGGGDIPRPARTGSPAQRQFSLYNTICDEDEEKKQVHMELLAHLEQSSRITGPESYTPDLEQNVIDQTEDVFQNFLYESWRRDSERETFLEQGTPSVPQLSNFTSDPLSASAQVGRRLAKIGDDIQMKYQGEFDGLIDELKVDRSTAYDAFAGVARRLVEGGLNWGRIVTLFSFGYRIFVRIIGLGEVLKDFGRVIGRIVTNVVTFIKDRTQGIARWIANQGGWQSALSYVPSVSWQVLTGIGLVALASLGIVYYLHNSGQ